MLDVLTSIADSIGDFLSNGLELLFNLIKSFYTVVINLFSDFISQLSSKLFSIGLHFISIFDFISFDSGFLSFDFVYVFVGILAIVFVFKLVWNLICSFF